MITVLDLFSGIGGFSLGLERTGGFKTVAFCEIDNYCQKVLHKHWPHVYIHSDIRTLGAKHFEHYRKPDLICGGFPCQDISVAGKQTGIEGERSGLWFEMLRVIQELRPTWLLIENVPNLRTKGADIVFAGLEEANYTWTSAVVGAWAVGAPHRRNRVWILAHSRFLDGQTRVGSHDSPTDSKWQSKAQERGTDRFIPELGAETVARLDTRFPCEPDVARMANGIPNGVDRRVCLGNSVVPQIPELFGHAILQLDKQFREAK